MPICPAGTSRPPKPHTGIILVELLVVIALIGLMVLLIAPNFMAALESTLERETSRLAGVIRMLRNEAVLKNTDFRLVMDLRQARYSVEQRDPYGKFVQRNEPPDLRPHSLPSGIQVRDLEILGDIIKPERGVEPVPIVIDASGYIDPFMLRFSYQDQEYTFRVKGFTGKVDLVEGYAKQ